MKPQAAILIMVLASLTKTALTQTNTPPSQAAPPPISLNGTVDKNVQQYIELMRSDIRHRKSEVMAQMMQLSANDAAKFWPIYNEYDAALKKLGDLRAANIEEYERTYPEMTNEKADELINKMLQYRKKRYDLLTEYYQRVKNQLGAIIAARFVQVEDQLVLIIDLQIDSSLPLVGQLAYPNSCSQWNRKDQAGAFSSSTCDSPKWCRGLAPVQNDRELWAIAVAYPWA